MGKIKKLQDKGATILPLTVADAVLMNSAEAGNLSTYLKVLKSGVDFLLSIIGEDQAGDIFLKTKDGMPRGFYTEGFVSAGGKSTTEGGCGSGGGMSVSQMWESLQGNNDTFKDRLINVAHIPTLTTGKISDFVSATQAIADTAVANKADKDKVVDLTSNQTISGEKTFSNFKVSNKNLVTNLNANMVGGYISSVLFTCESGYGVDVNAPHRNKKSGPLLYKISSNCTNIPPLCTDGVLVHFNSQGTDTAFQLVSDYSNAVLHYRSGNLHESSPYYLYNKAWKTIAFTNSNVASATKLQTARKIWGQNFNGTADVSGKMTNVTSIENTGGLSMRTNILSFEPENAGSLKGALIIGGTDLFGLAIWGVGSGESYIQSGRTDGKNAAYNLIIQHLGGKVGIGTNAPIEKLHVQGNIYSSGSVRIDGARLTYGTGTLTVDKSLTVASTLTATQGEFANYIKIGNATISWNPKGYLEINEGLASHKFISAGGVVTGDAGGGGGGLGLTDMWVSLNGNIDAYGKTKIHIDHIPLDVILSHDDYENDVADRINTFNYSNSSSFTSAVKALIVADNIPTLEMSKIEGLETTLTNIGTVVQNNYDNLNESISTLQNGTIADHEARIKAIEQALTWQKV